LYTAQKRNSQYAPQPYTSQSVFKSFLNCISEICLTQRTISFDFRDHRKLPYRLCSVPAVATVPGVTCLASPTLLNRALYRQTRRPYWRAAGRCNDVIGPRDFRSIIISIITSSGGGRRWR